MFILDTRYSRNQQQGWYLGLDGKHSKHRIIKNNVNSMLLEIYVIRNRKRQEFYVIRNRKWQERYILVANYSKYSSFSRI